MYWKVILTTISLFLTWSALAANLQVSDTEDYYQRYPDTIDGYQFTVSWEHSWRTDKNHDAAWVFLKSVGENGYDHVPLRPGSARVLWKGSEDMPDPELVVTDDYTGLFIYAGENYRGPLTYRIFVEYEAEALPENTRLRRGGVKGYGVEMVYIPEGGFTLGAPRPDALNYYAFYRSGRDGSYDGLYPIDREEQAIEVGPDPGHLYYRSDRAIYRGDQKGPIPAAFPKGVQDFYLMKYEVLGP